VIVQRVLQLDDTPHRIAFGVFLGFLIGATPTFGFQMLLYVTFATLLGANKIAGLAPVWISNPLTLVPLYYGDWLLGHLLLSGSVDDGGVGRQRIEALLATGDSVGSVWSHMFEASFWHQVVDVFFAIGAEMWVGSLVVGLGLGAIGYVAAYRGVIAYRRRRSSES